MIPPGISPRCYRIKFIIAVLIRQAAAGAEEVGVERRVMLIEFVDVPAGGIGLPDLKQGIGNGPSEFIGDPAVNDDAFSQRFAVLYGIPGEIVIHRRQVEIAEDRAGQFCQGSFQWDQRLAGRPKNGGFVAGGQARRLHLLIEVFSV